MKTRNILSLFVIIALLISSSAYAIDNSPLLEANSSLNAPNEKPMIRDALSCVSNTTDKTQNEYLKVVQDAIANDYTDEQAIQVVCEAFLTIGRASTSDTSSYNCAELVDPVSCNNNTIKYRLSEYQYLGALRKALGWDIVWDKLTFDNFKVSVSGDSATASIFEEYTYYANDGFNSESCRAREYTFTLTKNRDGWEITSVKTNDPCELDADFSYEAIDVSTAIRKLKTELRTQASMSTMAAKAIAARDEENLTLKTQDSTANASASSLYHWTYSPSLAVAYAQKYYKSVNPLFGEASADCQNFASQCVWAGFGGASSKTAIPAVSTSLVGQSSSRVWCKDQQSTYYSNWEYNWAWTYCRSFTKLIDTSSVSQVGPLGWVYYGNLLNACPGDVIQWDTGGYPSDTTVDHAMFVTEATGTKGTRTRPNIKICAHNGYTSYANEPLVNYAYSYMTDAYYANQRIVSGYYTTAQ